MSMLQNTAFRVAAVTPNDSTDLDEFHVTALRVEGAGTVAITTLGNDTVTLTAAAGETLHVQIKRVLATGTTATGIFALGQ